MADGSTAPNSEAERFMRLCVPAAVMPPSHAGRTTSSLEEAGLVAELQVADVHQPARPVQAQE